MSSQPKGSLERALQDPDYVDCTNYPGVQVDLRYGGTNNLLKRDVYSGFQSVLLHKIAAEKFAKACESLARQSAHHHFLVFDALRPRSAQIEFWNLVKGSPQESFFANPEKGSIHSFGLAIDLSLCDLQKQEIDMGTGFDDLTELAAPSKENELYQSGRLTQNQIQNRQLLRNVMLAAGFFPISHEWWHFDALKPAEVRAAFKQLE